MPPIYLDSNATTCIAPEVLEAMLPYFTTHYGNPSSSHEYGTKAAESIFTARQQIAQLINAPKPEEEIMFTSCATESINYTLKGTAEVLRKVSHGKMNHIITSSVEHVAVLETCRYLDQAHGFEITYLPVNELGQVSVTDVLEAIRPNVTFLISIMHSNNEVGTMQPIAEISRAVKARYPDMLMHTDASQSLGKVSVDVQHLGVDFLTMAGHKMYAPKGIGALYIRSSSVVPDIVKLLHGASHEHHRRAGTENVPYIVALGKAGALARESLPELTNDLRSKNKLLLAKIQEHLAGGGVRFRVNGHPQMSLPNTLSMSFENILAPSILSQIRDQVAASAGSACHSTKEGQDIAETTSISHVLQAMKIPPAFARGTIRLSVGKYTTRDEVVHAAKVLSEAILDSSQRSCPTSTSNAVVDLQEKDQVVKKEPTTKLYFTDSYCFESTATVVEVNPGCIQNPKLDLVDASSMVLDRSIFHPQGGGQPSDTGVIRTTVAGQDVEFQVVTARLDASSQQIIHYGHFYPSVNPTSEKPLGFATGQIVECHVDERHRRKSARLHSAGHVIDQAMKSVGLSELRPSKGYHFEDGPFVEYIGKIPSEMSKDTVVERLNKECQTLIRQSIPTIVQNCTTVKHLQEFYPDEDITTIASQYSLPVRMVIVANLHCPCGGTHVKNTHELELINITKIKSKSGKTKVYYTINDTVTTKIP